MAGEDTLHRSSREAAAEGAGFWSPDDESRAPLSNFVVMCAGFSINHATVVTVIALATTHLGTDLGAYDLAVFNIIYVITGLCVQGFVVKTLGLKGALVAGTSLYCFYVLSFLTAMLCPAESWSQWAVALIGAVAGGFGAGFLWSAQGAYFALNAELYAAQAGVARHTATAKLSGIFASWYLATEVATKVLASIVMGSSLGGEGNEHVLYILFAIVAGLSALSLSTIQDLSVSDTHPDQDKRDATSEPGAEGMVEAATPQPVRFAKLCSSVQLMASDAKCLLIVPTQMAFGFVAAMLNGWVNGVAVQHGVGTHNIGYLIALSTGIAALSARVFSWYTSHEDTDTRRLCDWFFVGKPGTMMVGAAAYVAFGLVLYSEPVDDLGQWRFLLPLYVLQGIGRGNFESTNKAVFADFFPGHKAEPAFANFVIWTGLSMSIGFLSIPHVPTDVLSAMCTATAAVGAVCYLFAHKLYTSSLAKDSKHSDLLLTPDSNVHRVESNPVVSLDDKN